LPRKTHTFELYIVDNLMQDLMQDSIEDELRGG